MDWKDIKLIVEIADKLLGDTPTNELLTKGEEAYYTTILDMYNSYKQEL